jgi:hypothetical protein
VAGVLAAREQQRVDVLEARRAARVMSDRQRRDDRPVQQVAGGLEDLALVDIEQRLDDPVGDRRRLKRERLIVVHA